MELTQEQVLNKIKEVAEAGDYHLAALLTICNLLNNIQDQLEVIIKQGENN